MAAWKLNWNVGMTLAVVLLVAGGVLVFVSRGPGDALFPYGVGILTLASLVYLGSRIWMLVRSRGR